MTPHNEFHSGSVGLRLCWEGHVQDALSSESLIWVPWLSAIVLLFPGLVEMRFLWAKGSLVMDLGANWKQPG